MEIRRCMNCMSELQQTDEVCPVCGYDNRTVEPPTCAMPCGSILHGKYLIGKVLGQGGFGITYIGLDLVLDIKVAIKEYYPMGMVTRDSGNSTTLLWNSSQMSQSQRQGAYDSFLKEARKMAKVDTIPSIVRVRDMLLENETAYIVMDYVKGVTLKDKLLNDGPMPFSQCISLLSPMMEGLARVHKQGMIHRDISPDNIMIESDGAVRLLDLGAAKDLTNTNGPKSQLVAKKGFSPLEQYVENGKIGPWTDVYALCATIYYVVTRKMLPAALDRVMGDSELIFDSSLAEPLSDAAVKVLKDGLALKPEERIQSVEELLQRLDKAVQGQAPAADQRVAQTQPRQEPDLEATRPPRQEADLKAARPPRQEPDLEAAQPFRQEPDLEAAQPFRQEPDLKVTQPLRPESESETAVSLKLESTPGAIRLAAVITRIVSKCYTIMACIAFLLMICFAIAMLNATDGFWADVLDIIPFIYIPLLPFLVIFAPRFRERVFAGISSLVMLLLIYSFLRIVSKAYLDWGPSWWIRQNIESNAAPVAIGILVLHIVVFPFCMLLLHRFRLKNEKQKKGNGSIAEPSSDLKTNLKWQKPVIAIALAIVLELVFIVMIS